VFDLGRSQYRISANIRYVTDRQRVGRVYIRYVMAHDEYDRRSRAGTL
jgi:mRNA-degrading endonuclease HigB of HigAB toxin-antitoxin module